MTRRAVKAATLARCVARKYRVALKELTRDALRDFGGSRIPTHLRVAIKSHAQHLARARCELHWTGPRRRQPQGRLF